MDAGLLVSQGVFNHLPSCRVLCT